jgi:hypothetical protein
VRHTSSALAKPELWAVPHGRDGTNRMCSTVGIGSVLVRSFSAHTKGTLSPGKRSSVNLSVCGLISVPGAECNLVVRITVIKEDCTLETTLKVNLHSDLHSVTLPFASSRIDVLFPSFGICVIV